MNEPLGIHMEKSQKLREQQVERHTRVNGRCRVRDSSPSTWWERRCMASVAVIQVQIASLD